MKTISTTERVPAEFLVKHAKRSSACGGCGEQTYWAHDIRYVPDGMYDCGRCGVQYSGWVRMDKLDREHICSLEKKQYTLYLNDPGPNKLQVVHQVRQIMPNLGLVEVRDLVRGQMPVAVGSYNELRDAENDRNDLERIGAQASVFCADRDEGPDDSPADSAAEKPAEAPQEPAEGQDALATLRKILAPSVDEETVRRMVTEAMGSITYPTATVVERASGETKTVEGAHRMLPEVLTDLAAGLHVMMVGPAGTGKSTIAEGCAEGLDLPFYSISLSPMTPMSQILGYMQATGEYIRSPYREAYEHGGVYHFDEIDNSHPSALATINASLSNSVMAFPDGMVKRHDNFRCVASANTYGKGADRQYVGRQQMDAATLDRFCVETVQVDEVLEIAICRATGLETKLVDEVLSYTRRLRKSAEDQGMRVIVSPRASAGMCRLLHAGKEWDAAAEAVIFKGMSDGDRRKIGA